MTLPVGLILQLDPLAGFGLSAHLECSFPPRQPFSGRSRIFKGVLGRRETLQFKYDLKILHFFLCLFEKKQSIV